MDFINIERLTIQKGTDGVRVVIRTNGVNHMDYKPDLFDCFDSINEMLTSPDYPEKLKHFKDNR